MPQTGPKPKAKPMAEPKPTPDLTPAPQGKGPERPDAGPNGNGTWDIPRNRRQEAVNAVSGQRFPPRYEELLRAYYRSLAAGRDEE